MATCLCSWLRNRYEWDETMEPGGVAEESRGAVEVRRGFTRYPARYFAVCRVCHSRWTVTEEADAKERELLYHWREEDWTDEDLVREREREEAEIRDLTTEQDRKDAARPDQEWRRALPSLPGRLETTIEETGPLEWRWEDERGVSYGCRVEGARLAVWTDGPFGGTGTEYGLDEFLHGACSHVLPAAVADRVRRALDVAR
jgi:hypothetical protein